MMQDKLANTTDMNSLVSMLSRREYSLAVGKKFSFVSLGASRRTAADTSERKEWCLDEMKRSKVKTVINLKAPLFLGVRFGLNVVAASSAHVLLVF